MRITKGLVLAVLLGGVQTLSAYAQPGISAPAFFDGHGKAQTEVPLWTVSGAWHPDGDSFYLIDVLQNSILQYGLDGERLEKFGPKDMDRKKFRPTFIQTDPSSVDNFIVQTSLDGFFWLSARTPRIFVQRRFVGTKNSVGERIGKITTWVAARDFITAFGDFQDRDGAWFSGYARIPVEQPEDFSIIDGLRLPVDSRIVDRHLLGYSFSAVTPDGDTTVTVLAGSPTRLLEVTADSHEIRTLALSRAVPSRGLWEDWSFEDDAVEKLKALGKGSAITNIAADEAYYYLIQKNGEQWSLERFERSSLAPAGSLRDLPFEARHIVVVPSEDKLLVVSKKQVKALGDQEVDSFRILDLHGLF